MEARVEALETKISYQERLIQELNEVIIAQQNQIDKIEKTLLQMRDYVQNIQGQEGALPQEAPPPHY